MKIIHSTTASLPCMQSHTHAHMHAHTYAQTLIKGMEHVPNIFMSFDKYLFLKVINILV